VILKPGGHLVNKEVAHKIIDFIAIAQTTSKSGLKAHTKSSLTIEPTLLSVILRELNNQRLKAGLEDITLELVSKNHPEHILSEFYESALKGLDLNIHRFIEQQLLTASGARNRIAEEDAIARHSISDNDIAKLIDRRIIQRDKIAQVTWLELSHDTLTPVVSRHARIHRKKIKIKRRIIQAGSAILLVVIVGVAVIYKQRNERELQVKKASKMALELATVIENNSSMSMSSKKDLMSRLQKSFDELREVALESELLRLRNAQFLVVNADMQFESGYYQRAHENVLDAEKLLFDSTFSEGEKNNAALINRARVKIFKARSVFYNSDYEQVHKELDSAQDILLQLQSNPQISEIESHKIEQDINRMLIQTSMAEYQYSKTFHLLKITQSKLRKLLVAPPIEITDSDKQHLYNNLLELDMHEYEIMDFGFYDKDKLFSKFRVDLEQASPLFKDDDHRFWQVFDAKSYWLKAEMHKGKLETTETRAAYDRAIELFTDLVRRSPDNLKYRYDLAKSLIKRATYSEQRDNVQAKYDINAVRALSSTLRRDSSHPYPAHNLSTLADVNKLRLDSYNEKSSLDESFDRTIARNANYHRKTKSKQMFFNMKIFAHYWKIRGSIKRLEIFNKKPKQEKDEKKNNDAALSKKKLQAVKIDVANALVVMEKLKALGADNVYLAHRTYYIYQSITNDSRMASLLGDELWNKYLLATIEQLEILESSVPNHSNWSTNKIWPLIQLGKSFQKQENELEASKAYHKFIQIGIKQSKLNNIDKGSLTNTLWGIRRLIELNQERLNWQGVTDSAEMLFQLFDPNSEDQEIRFPSDVLRYWKSSDKALRKATSILENRIYDGKNAEISPSSQNNSGSNLLGFEKRIRQQLDRSAIAMEQIEKIAILQSKENEIKYAENEAETNYDIKSLNLPRSVVINKGIASSSKPLGWKTDAVYKVQGSYTLSGEQVKEYSKKLEQRVSWVRVAKLPFYESANLLTIESEDADDRTQVSYFLESKEKGLFFKLVGTSPAIHDANTKFGLILNTRSQVVAYLRFFDTFVHGDEGAFILVETSNEIAWSQGVAQQEKDRVANLLRPIFVWTSEDGSGDWYATGTVSYSNALFYVKFKIHKSGMVEMLEDKPIASDLPIDSFKIAEKSGRLSHYISNFYLELTKDITIDGISSEIRQLYKLLKGEKIKNSLHRENIFNEIVSLSEVKNEIGAVIELTSFLHQEPENFQARNRIYVEHATNTLIKNEIESINRLEKQTPLPKDELKGKYLGLSFYQLFASDFNGALESSKKGLKLDKNHLPLHTNFAHALLFLNRTKEAMDIYHKYMGEKYGYKIWEDIILDDFDQLSEAGITHPDMEIIRKEFSKEKTAELATPADE